LATDVTVAFVFVYVNLTACLMSFYSYPLNKHLKISNFRGDYLMSNNVWWNLPIDETAKLINSDPEHGLTNQEALKRKEIFNNTFISAPKIHPAMILLNQFTDTMVLVLLAATVISGLVGAMGDAMTIMAIVVINAVLGFVQEYRAEKSLEEIKKLAAPTAIVIRSGKRIKIAAEDLVPGDLVLIEAGDKIPADLRLVNSSSLEIDESALTGESVPVSKHAGMICPLETVLAERSNLCFMGTSVTRGRGRALVVGTGMDTIMGEIAAMMKDNDKSMTPLQIRLDQLGKILIIICIAVCALVTVLGILRGEKLLTMFMAGISLAVAAIPEGLPAIVTVVLGLGVQRMARRNAIIRKLPAVETLGCTTVICSDKTGTLTRNQMTVKKMAAYQTVIEVDGDGYQIEGKFKSMGKPIDPLHENNCRMIMKIALNCNQAILKQAKKGYEVEGDPTEGALLIMAAKAGLQQRQTILREIPFDSNRKCMTVIIEENGEYLALVKGALEVILPACDQIVKADGISPLKNEERKYFLKLQAQWADEAMRVLGFAYKRLQRGEWEGMSDVQLESGLILTGICGMIDPPREGAARSVKQCLNAGIIPVMITGDHPLTASAIARNIGMVTTREVITGQEIDQLDDEKLYRRVIKERVLARVSPQHKNRIVQVLKSHGQVVAMTGDGINDAPAIKAADIGIAMGISGTEVSKEASAMVLTDDDFSTIVKAVYEGRAIYDNIRKFIRYLLGCNIGEVLVMLLASIMALPLPMLPIQILWVNLVTDGLPAMALGMEPPEPGIMKRRPRPKNESIFAHKMAVTIFSRGIYIAIITIAIFMISFGWSASQGQNGLDLARTMAFTTLVFAQLFYVFECRSETISPFELGFFKNKFLIVAVCFSIIMQLCVIYMPFLQSVFKTVPLLSWQWLLILSLSGIKVFGRLFMYTWQRVFVSNLRYVKME
jgi:Ca2+-transporting ATPase